MRPYQLPDLGVSDAMPFIDTPGQVCPPDSMRNARVLEAATKRRRMSRRPGAAEVFEQAIGTGAVQGVGVVTRASAITGYELGECTDMGAFTSRDAIGPTGHLFIFDSVPSNTAEYFHDVTNEGGPASNSANCVAVNRASTKIAYSTNYVDTSGRIVTTIVCVSSAGEFQWSRRLTDSSRDVYTNSMRWSKSTAYDFLFACVGRRIYVIRGTDGEVLDGQTMNEWSSEAIECGSYMAGSVEYVIVAFNGASFGTTLPNTPNHIVVAGAQAVHFRSGLAKFLVLSTGILSQVEYGDGLDSSDEFYEGNHGYLRVSEVVSHKPWGCLINAMRVHTDGSVVVGRTNQGWGPNTSYPPDGTAYPNVSVFKINANATLAWEADTDSIVEAGAGGYYNDIPSGAGDEPSVLAVAIDRDGDVYAGGRQTAAGMSLYRLRGSDGVRVWDMNLMSAAGVIRQAAIEIDPTDNCPVVAGDRNSSWDGATGVSAHMWKVNRATAGVIWSSDIPTTSVSGLGIAPLSDGRIALACDKVAP